EFSMKIDDQKLEQALTLIREDEAGVFTSSVFDNLLFQVRINATQRLPADCPEGQERVARLSCRFDCMHQDLWNILTLIQKLEWMRQMVLQGKLDHALQARFAASDIDMFHIELRALFDYLAKAVKAVSSQPNQTPGDSFNSLLTWLKKPSSDKS